MPLIYLPLIMYASWMEFMVHTFRIHVEASDTNGKQATA